MSPADWRASFTGILDKAEVTPVNSKKVVLFLIDGFGYKQWLNYADKYEFLKRFTKKGVVTPITTVFPSTTAAALTTINSGLTPQEHGLPEWWVYFDEIGKMTIGSKSTGARIKYGENHSKLAYEMGFVEMFRD